MRNGNRARVEELTQNGLTAVQIARRLKIAPGTVYAHRHAIRNRQSSWAQDKNHRPTEGENHE